MKFKSLKKNLTKQIKKLFNSKFKLKDLYLKMKINKK